VERTETMRVAAPGDLPDEKRDILKRIEELKPETFSRYEDARQRLLMQTGPAKMYEIIADGIPHKIIGDIMLIYRIDLRDDGIEGGSVIVANELMEEWGITQEQLHADAKAAQMARKPPLLLRMGDVIRELSEEVGEPESEDTYEIPLWVASTMDGRCGAAAIWNEEFLDRAAGTIGGNFYAIPASMCEFIFFEDDSIDIDWAKMAVLKANAEVVLPREYLSSTIYHYDREAKLFETAEDYERRTGRREE